MLMLAEMGGMMKITMFIGKLLIKKFQDISLFEGLIKLLFKVSKT